MGYRQASQLWSKSSGALWLAHAVCERLGFHQVSLWSLRVRAPCWSKDRDSAIVYASLNLYTCMQAASSSFRRCSSFSVLIDFSVTASRCSLRSSHLSRDQLSVLTMISDYSYYSALSSQSFATTKSSCPRAASSDSYCTYCWSIVRNSCLRWCLLSLQNGSVRAPSVVTSTVSQMFRQDRQMTNGWRCCPQIQTKQLW